MTRMRDEGRQNASEDGEKDNAMAMAADEAMDSYDDDDEANDINEGTKNKRKLKN